MCAPRLQICFTSGNRGKLKSNLANIPDAHFQENILNSYLGSAVLGTIGLSLVGNRWQCTAPNVCHPFNEDLAS